MNSRASGRLALTIAAAFLVAALTTKPLQACENCSPTDANQAGKAANALPTYPDASEEVSAPVALKKFTKSQSRQARRTQPRKASLAERANASKYAARTAKPAEQDEAPLRAKTAGKVAPLVANANAELVEAGIAKIMAPSGEASPAVGETRVVAPEPVQAPLIELVSAEEFNELDRAAWEANQMPKLMKLTASDSRAELREDDSKWAQTSTIGKLFVAFGALLTLGSAIRMFMA
jgi:hypothetical protein